MTLNQVVNRHFPRFSMNFTTHFPTSGTSGCSGLRETASERTDLLCWLPERERTERETSVIMIQVVVGNTTSSRHLIRRRRRHARDAVVTHAILLGSECVRDGVVGTLSKGLRLEKPWRADCRRHRCPVETNLDAMRGCSTSSSTSTPLCAIVRRCARTFSDAP